MRAAAPSTGILPPTLPHTAFSFLGQKIAGKVRDTYLPSPATRVLVTTDRQSAFDELWCTIPLKGVVLNSLSAWWFERVADIMPTHILAVPDPCVTVVKNLHMIKVEIVVRAYLTGSTDTSAWVNYSRGLRLFCGNILPEGLRRNQRLSTPIVTPTTKGDTGDELIDPAQIIQRGLLTALRWEEVADRALALFRRGQEIASARGLILVDTKYEMGFDSKGTLTLGDEVHTPDSSRYWLAESYEDRFEAMQEPESLDKEFFRLWLRSQGFIPGKARPVVTDDICQELSHRYIDLFERMTGAPLPPLPDGDPLHRIEQSLRTFFHLP